MILDGHIHVTGKPANQSDLLKKMNDAGVGGGVILSKEPNSFVKDGNVTTAAERLENLLSWTDGQPGLYPFYWIDPIEGDALEQVEMALSKNVSGFKVICNAFYPGDKRAMKVYEAIAASGRPILFHSGILWDGAFSSPYNRPAEFEALIEIKGLKFALAHISWPWCDECLAVFGKFLNAYTLRPDLSVEMFIDLTPGTPAIYRNEAITRLYSVGYDIEDNIIFGTDCTADDYNANWTREWIDRDCSIFKKLGLSDLQIRKVYSGNLQRFLGLSGEKATKRALMMGQ